jgi:hypothetical protein
MIADPHEDTRPDDFQYRLESEEYQRKNREHDQGGNTAAWNNPVINLKHVERTGQHQDIDNRAEEADRDKCCFGSRKRPPELGAGVASSLSGNAGCLP